MLEREYVKKYLRIDFDCDDGYIDDLIQMSKDFIKEQTGVEYNESDTVYTQALLLMIAHFYDNRTPVSEKAVSEIPFSLGCMLKHIGMRGSIVPSPLGGEG